MGLAFWNFLLKFVFTKISLKFLIPGIQVLRSNHGFSDGLQGPLISKLVLTGSLNIPYSSVFLCDEHRRKKPSS